MAEREPNQRHALQYLLQFILEPDSVWLHAAALLGLGKGPGILFQSHNRQGLTWVTLVPPAAACGELIRV